MILGRLCLHYILTPKFPVYSLYIRTAITISPRESTSYIGGCTNM